MIARFLLWIDDRLGTAHFASKALRKAFPDHWSFMLGEINAYAFLVLLGTGLFVAYFFHPDASKTIYHGAFVPLQGSLVSKAFDSVVALSFDVNGGLLIRQVHHWAANVFLAGIVAHMVRIFLTGAFRRPRELNWVIGLLLFLLAMAAGFTGYSLPDDLLSGTGLRIADSVALSIPAIGTWIAFLFFGGSFPTEQTIPRLFVTHVVVLPAAIAGLIGLHLAILWRQHHSQFPGPLRTERNVVGSPLYPRYAAKSIALLLATVAVTFALGALVQINPVWLWGPYDPWHVLAPAQPDWYVGWLDGALRIGPPFALHLFGHTIPSPFWPAVLLPAVLFALLLGWPWIEAALRRDREPHQLLDLPRDVPLRFAFGAALFALASVLTLAGSDDVQARYVHTSITALTALYRVLFFAAPPIVFAITYAVAAELRARGGVREAPRVRLRRNARGGFEEEPLG